jgi:phage shock protein PspC (stress-responsive transcriptional regulator)
MYHRVRRTTGKNAKIFGVCRGISRYIDPEADPIIMRLVFVLMAIFSGILPMAFVYIVLAMVLKKDEPTIEEEKVEVNI